MSNKMNESQIFLGMDVGFGDVKVTVRGADSRFPEERFKFPSVVAFDKSSIEPNEKKNRFAFKGHVYLLGQDAVHENNCIEYDCFDSLLNNYPLFIYKAMHEAAKLYDMETVDFIGLEKSICLGVPLGFFVDYKDRLQKIMESFEGEKTRFDLKGRVNVKVQGQGVLLDFIRKSEPKFRRWYGRRRTVTILDIGYNLINVLCVEGGRPNGRLSKMLVGKGVRILAETVRSYLKDKYNCRELTDHYVKEVLEKKTIVYDGNIIDLSDYIEEQTRDYAKIVSSQLENNIGAFRRRSEKIIIAGGGAYYLEPELKKKFGGGNIEDYVYCPECPEFSNSRGYCEAADLIPRRLRR